MADPTWSESSELMPSGWRSELAALVGTVYVEESEDALEWARWDACGGYRLGGLEARAARPLAVIRPGNAAEVAEVIRWAVRRHVPLVPRGAGTGIMGGAIPLRPALVVDVGRLDDIVVHPDDLLVEAGAGAVLSDVGASLASHGLELGHDPWSVSMATVGGAIGTDGVGYAAGRWGSMGEQVAGIEAVLPDGTLVRTPPVKPATGPEVRALFTGSQGSFGIVTRAWLRAVPAPETRRFAAFRFAGFEPGFQALLALWRTGLRYDLLDFSDEIPEALDLERGMEDDDGRTALLHLGAFGPGEETAARLAVARRVLAGAAVELDPGRAASYWNHRHDLAETYARQVHRPRDPVARRRFGETGFDYLNLALPPSRIIEYRRYCLNRVAAHPGLTAGETGIWCRPEIFSLVVHELPEHGTQAGPSIEPEPSAERSAAPPFAEHGRKADAMHRLLDDLLLEAVRLGGDLECIHGTGLKLLPLLDAGLGTRAAVARRLKSALDPGGLLNPGKL